MLSKRNMIPLFLKLNFTTMHSKRLLYLHIIILSLIYFQKKILVLIFIVELCFNLMIILLANVAQRRLLIMMFPMHQVLMMIKFTHVVGSLNWKSGMSIIIGVQMSYSPTDNSYLSLKQLSVIFVIKIVSLQQMLFYTKNMCIYAFLCLLVLFVISPILLVLAYGCMLLNLMEVWKEQFL